MGNRERDSAAAGAKFQYSRVSFDGQGLERDFYQKFGFGPWNEHAAIHFEVE